MEIGVRDLRNRTAVVIDAVQAGERVTSVFIARESGRALGQLPDQVAVSVATLGELQLGVLAAEGQRDPSAPRPHAGARANRGSD